MASDLCPIPPLEDETHRAVERALLGKELGAPSNIAVWPSWQHACIVWRLRSVTLLALFRDAECIHVGTERYGPVAVTAFERADNPGAANPFGHLVKTELPKLGSDESAGAPFLETELRMGVQIAAPSGHFPFESIQVETR
jgi:hypothetical protein